MVMIALCSSLIGAVLGTRFKVYALFPATMLGLLLVAATAVFRGAPLASAISAAMVWTTSMQAGYMGGLLTRFSLVASRLPAHRSLRSTTAQS